MIPPSSCYGLHTLAMTDHCTHSDVAGVRLAIEGLVGHIQATKPEKITEKTSGDEGIRTPDIRVANAALYQLSYVPAGPRAVFAGRGGSSLAEGSVDEQHALTNERLHEELTIVLGQFGRHIGKAHGTRS